VRVKSVVQERLARGRVAAEWQKEVDMMENDESGIITNHFCLATSAIA